MDTAYEPIRASLMTGLFPGFALPHFALRSSDILSLRPNAFYVQRLHGGRIAAFDLLEAEELDLGVVCRPNAPSEGVQVGDAAVYAYAFAHDDIVIGAREHIVNLIRDRFEEIAPKTFAARTAARFAGLRMHIGELNRRALREILEVDSESASLWRDYDVFLPALRERLNALGANSDAVHIVSRVIKSRLTATVDLFSDALGIGSPDKIAEFARESLMETGLFDIGDRVKVRIRKDTLLEPQVDRASLLREVRTAPLDRAKAFLDEKVFLPVIENPQSLAKAKNAVRATRIWISQFRKIGDLIEYVDRFRPSMQHVLPFPNSSSERRRLEDVHAEFVRTFSRYRNQTTTIRDFREGATYGAFELSIFTQTYDNRSGGIRPVGKLGQHSAVVVNLTMSGGKYANTWIEFGKRLKCYLKIRNAGGARRTRKGYDVNRSILDFPDVSVMVFTRETKEADFTYQGPFRLLGHGNDPDGSRWIELTKL